MAMRRPADRTGPNRRALNPSPTVGTRLFFSRYGAPRPKL